MHPELFRRLADVGAHPAAGERLERYLELLARWGRVHNLVARPTDRAALERHVAEALAGVPLLGGERGRLLDVGAGAGFPAIPLLAARPGWRGVLLEPRQKRWAFLRAVVRELALAAEVRRERYEAYAGTGFERVTARAVGGWERLLAWAAARLAPEGEVLLWLAAGEAERLAALPGWRVVPCPLPEPRHGVVARARPCFT